MPRAAVLAFLAFLLALAASAAWAGPAAAVSLCYGHGCASIEAACAPEQALLVACDAGARVAFTGAEPVYADTACWAGQGQGFDPQPQATATGAWCATDTSHTPAILGVPGLMLADDGARVCAYLFTNYAFGFRLLCLPPSLR